MTCFLNLGYHSNVTYRIQRGGENSVTPRPYCIKRSKLAIKVVIILSKVLSLIRTPGDRQNLIALSGICIDRCFKY